ncbi:MAG TPA: hypothetical protein VMH22_04510 [bacterium]|nr:hypothetical protein [bacterium]
MNSSRDRGCRRVFAVGIVVLGLALVLNCGQHHPPVAPAAPVGPSFGTEDSSCTFTTMTIDPEGDSVCYRFAWGDGDTSSWTAKVPSGQSGEASHVWNKSGAFEVTAQARDAGDRMSNWSSAHQVLVAAVWSRTFGGTGHEDCESALPTSDGGYILAASTESFGAGGYDIWLIKTDSAGDTLWTRTYGAAGTEWGGPVALTSDGGYIVAGYTDSYGAGGGDIWLIKTDSGGNKLWDKTFGGPAQDIAREILPTADGGYIIVGNTLSYGAGVTDVWLIKTDSAGNKLWDMTYGGTKIDKGCAAQPTTDGGYIVAAATESFGAGNYDVWLIKTDANGNELWDKTIGGAGYDAPNEILVTADGGYVVVGETESYGAGGYDVWLVKTDADGNKIWDRTFGGAKNDDGQSVAPTSDGGYIVAAYSASYGAGGFDAWLIKTDAAGYKLWDSYLAEPVTTSRPGFGRPRTVATSSPASPTHTARVTVTSGWSRLMRTDADRRVRGRVSPLLLALACAGLVAVTALSASETQWTGKTDWRSVEYLPGGHVVYFDHVPQSTNPVIKAHFAAAAESLDAGSSGGIAELEQALALAKGSQLAALHSIIAYFQLQFDEDDDGLSSLSSACDAAVKIGDSEGLGAALSELGNLHTAREDWDLALRYARQALQVNAGAGLLHGKAYDEGLLGELFASRGAMDSSLAYLRDAYDADIKCGDYREAEYDQYRIGSVCEQRADSAGALKSYLLCWSLVPRGGTEVGRDDLLSNLNVYYRKMGEEKFSAQCGKQGFSQADADALVAELRKTK